MGDKPVDLIKLTQLEELNRQFTIVIDAELKRRGLKGQVGFALLMFSFGEGAEMTWASNAERRDMITALKEFIAKNEAGSLDELKRNDRWLDRQN